MTPRLWWGIATLAMMVGMGLLTDAISWLDLQGGFTQGVAVAAFLATCGALLALVKQFAKARAWGLNHRKMTIAIGVLFGALIGGVIAFGLTRPQPQKLVLTQLPPYARFIRDSVSTLAHEIELVSGKQFRNEIRLMDGEQLSPDHDPQSMFALTPNAGFCFVESLKPIPTAFASVEQFLYRNGPYGRVVTAGYEEVSEEYHSLQSMRWVLNTHKYKDGVDLSGGQRFHICLYGLRQINPLVLSRLRTALDRAEAKLLATPIELPR